MLSLASVSLVGQSNILGHVISKEGVSIDPLKSRQ